jgi:hypothetical protein
MAGTPRFRWLLVTGLAVVVALLGIRLFARFNRTDESVSDSRFRATRSAAASLQMRPLHGRNDVIAALQALTFSNGSLATASQRETLIAFLADLVATYHVEPDSAAYRQWQREQGNVMKDAARADPREWDMEMIADVFSRHANDSVAVAKAIDEKDTEALFEISWGIARRIGDGASIATQIASDARGMVGEFIVLSKDQPHWPPISDDPLDGAFAGGSASGGRLWFRQPRTLAALLAGDHQVIGAVVRVFFEFRDGIRRPFHFWCFFDPIDGRWRVENVIESNVPDDHLGWPWDM